MEMRSRLGGGVGSGKWGWGEGEMGRWGDGGTKNQQPTTNNQQPTTNNQEFGVN